MAQEVSQILAMLREGKITAAEAEKLISALNAARHAPGDQFPFEAFAQMGRGRRRARWRRRGQQHEHEHGPRFLRIVVDEHGDGKRERVNIKVPIKLLKAGISLGGLMPKEAKEKIGAALKSKGIDVDPFSLAGGDADEIVEALSDLEIDIDGAGGKVRILVVHSDDGDDDEEDLGSDRA